VIPAGQRDATRVATLVNMLRMQGIEVGRATAEVKLKETGKLHIKGKEYVVEDGDIINIDVDSRTLSVEGIDVEERLKDWSAPEPAYRTGVMARYALLVGSASEGAILKP